MRNPSFLLLLLFFMALAAPLAAEENTSDVQAVFLHNGEEYSPALLADLEEAGALPEDLSLPIDSGDTLGWRRFEEGKLKEKVIGTVAKDGRVALSNGIEFSAAERTVFQCLLKLRSIYYTFHSADFGYPESPPPARDK